VDQALIPYSEVQVKKFMKGKEAYAAELIGTFFLVLCGTGAVAAGSGVARMGNPLGGAFAFGLAVMVLVYAFGPISGGHFNPAVTLGAFRLGRIKKEKIVPYISCQILGAILASLVLKLLVSPSRLGVTSSPLQAWQAWGIELLITFLLVTVILAVTDEAKSLGSAAIGLAIGGAITVGAIWAGPLTDASMNPARSLGPALVSGEFKQLWIYLTAPLAGGWLAAAAFRLLRPTSK
jgi:aquaporin Z